jgi:hemerythrin-like domain-containing protein
MPYTDTTDPVHIDGPLAEFSECHHDFVAQLHSALYLPELVAAAGRARAMANDLLVMFSKGVLRHHDDEERELFPAVLNAAQPGDEIRDVREMVDRLVAEHHDMARRWQELEPSVRAVAAGETPTLDSALLEDMVQHFFAHAHYEEEHFLPVAQRILGRHTGDMTALGEALRARHATANLA